MISTGLLVLLAQLRKNHQLENASIKITQTIICILLLNLSDLPSEIPFKMAAPSDMFLSFCVS